MKPIITIEYCQKCGWMLRAAYMAQEFLITFSDDVEAVVLKPGSTNGIFQISVNNKMVFDRKANRGFKEIKELKQLLRDEINPEMNLGHSDRNRS